MDIFRDIDIPYYGIHNMILIVNLQLNFSNFNVPAVRSFVKLVDLSKFLAYQFHTKEKVIWMWF